MGSARARCASAAKTLLLISVACDLDGFVSPHGTMRGIPSGYVNSLLLKMAIEIVDFPIRNGDFNHSYGTVYQRVPSANLWKDGIVHHVYRHCHLSWLRVVIVVNNVFF